MHRRRALILRLTRDGKFQWQADAGLTLLSPGEEQVTEGFFLVRRDLMEDNSVGDRFSRGSGLPGPDHLGFHLDRAAIRLEANAEGGPRLEAVGQVHTGS
ncbi:MAG: hypothetical protein A3H39_17495 [candidate division NC10 bacterium RIFCSPLOWO2_02_FULL_66_22]|nr:MAG: hypothetical protein A3H39_17495 [candidate division NC10 bacterium RIFCSPLOWO2_02_FULL_66_22]